MEGRLVTWEFVLTSLIVGKTCTDSEANAASSETTLPRWNFLHTGNTSPSRLTSGGSSPSSIPVSEPLSAASYRLRAPLRGGVGAVSCSIDPLPVPVSSRLPPAGRRFFFRRKLSRLRRANGTKSLGFFRRSSEKYVLIPDAIPLLFLFTSELCSVLLPAWSVM